jgi:hypothetical protein
MHKNLLVVTIMLFSISAKAQNYREAYYFNGSGQKISGLISMSPTDNRIHFKQNKDASSEKIKIENIKSVVLIGLINDSLTVLNDGKKDNKKYFSHFLLASPNTRFYIKYRIYNSGGVPTLTYTGLNTYRWTTSRSYYGTAEITMYGDGNTTYELRKSNYVEVLSKAFADVPELAQAIQNKEFKFRDLNKIFIQYKQKSSFRESN